MSSRGQLFAVQTHMEGRDYLSAESFERKIAALFGKIGAHRRKDVPGLAVFPEMIGLLLTLLGSSPEILEQETVDKAFSRIARRSAISILAAMLRYGEASPLHGFLLSRAAAIHRVYTETFRRHARREGLWVVAGSLLLPDNALGRVAEDFRPRDRRIFNVSYTFDPEGRIANVTRKVNLVPTKEDVIGLTPGRPEDLQVVDTPLGRVGNLICYDGFREPHTHDEPRFRALGDLYDRQAARILVQPSANPWPWEGRWVFCDPGENVLRREQWLREGLFAQLPALANVRYAVNPQLLLEVFDLRFDGRSYIFERARDGTARVIAEARSATVSPESEEIVMAEISDSSEEG